MGARREVLWVVLRSPWRAMGTPYDSPAFVTTASVLPVGESGGGLPAGNTGGIALADARTAAGVT
jgi:hypothetical protein